MNRFVNVKSHFRRGKRVRSYLRTTIPPGLKHVQYFKDKPYIAKGVDTAGRIQYVYPKRVLERGTKKKFSRIERLAERKDEFLDRIKNDARDGRVEAQAVYTMFKTGFRPGSDKDTKAKKKAYGVTTLLKDHVKVRPPRVEFDFIGKKGVRIKKTVKDSLLAKIIKEHKDSRRLFDTSDAEVREYFDTKTQGRFQLKDIRTLKAFEVADEVLEKTKSKDPAEIKKKVVAKVSEELGNTPTVAATSYIAPKLENL